MNIFISGANRGLGLALSAVFVKNGHKTYAGVFKDQPYAELEALASKYSSLVIVDLDVTSTASVENAAQLIAGDCGMLDAVISNAGILCGSDRTVPLTGADMDDFELSAQINILGAARIIKSFHNIVKDSGFFITITSEAGSVTNNGTVYPVYSVTKAAENKLVAVFRATKPNSYKIYAMHPGRMNTEMGREYAQIEPEESAESIFEILTGKKNISARADWFINYKGEPMTI